MRAIAMRAAVSSALLCLAGLALAPGARAQDAGNPDTFWRASAYLWWANIDGVNFLGDSTVVVGDSTSLYASFAGELEFGKGRLRGIGKFSTTSLSHTGPLRGPGVPDGTQVDYDFTWTMASAMATWQAGRFETGHAFLLSLGLRYVHQSQDLTSVTGFEPVSKDWVEPVAGAEYYVEMGGPFWISVDGDLGGFVFGSEFTMRVGAEFGVRVAGPVSLSLAYDYLTTSYGDPGDAYRLEDGVSQGWLFGLTVKR